MCRFHHKLWLLFVWIIMLWDARWIPDSSRLIFSLKFFFPSTVCFEAANNEIKTSRRVERKTERSRKKTVIGISKQNISDKTAEKNFYASRWNDEARSKATFKYIIRKCHKKVWKFFIHWIFSAPQRLLRLASESCEHVSRLPRWYSQKSYFPWNKLD